jgi:hypothetical protein
MDTKPEMPPLPDDPLDFAILLFKNLANRQVDPPHVTGTLESALDFQAVQAALELHELWDSGDEATRSLEYHLPHTFFVSLNHLLQAPARRITPPPRFYLADTDTLYAGSLAGMSDTICQYISATKLFTLLAKVADHQGGVGDDKTLIFLRDTKIEITSEYSSEALCALSGLSGFETDFINSDTHQEQKRTIIKTILFELFSGLSKIPFDAVLKSFQHFLDKAKASYQLYVAEFSFQKVKAEVEKEKLDAMFKLNKVFSDIQNQMLAIPLALMLAGGQMETSGVWSNKNLLIWLSALFFTIMMYFFIKNQRHTLKAVEQEIEQQRQQIKNKYRAVADRFEQIYDEIHDRYLHQSKLLRGVWWVVLGSFFVTTIMLMWSSGVFQYLAGMVGCNHA